MRGETATTFLGKLARNQRGNTIAMMAAFLIPLAALAGSAVDTARMYVVKVRLQQACDAGALAGRKFMNDTGSTLDANSKAQATAFFNNNFRSGWMGTTAVSFLPTKTAESQVAATASASVPMTLMQMFGATAVVVPVSCEARYDVADADIMFVLDTTGSMACSTADDTSTCDYYAYFNTVKNADGTYSITEKSDSRISGLRTAVLNFYDTVTANADPTTHFRFGFVPYSATVNVGKLLPRSYLATTNWTYQSRSQTTDVLSTTTSPTPTSTTQTACTNQNNVRNPTSGYLAADWSYTITTAVYTVATGKCATTINKYIANYIYAAKQLNVGAYADGTTVATPTFPLMAPGVPQPTSTWAGCIEERDTTASSSFNAASPPLDLDVDTVPFDEGSRWRPLWPEVSFARASQTSETSTLMRTIDTRYQFGGAPAGQQIAYPYNELPCPKQAQRLTTQTRANINTYLTTAFRPYGVTYHDAGMTWGTRLLSPTGMFKTDTAAWPNHNDPSRYIVFLTDGAMEPDLYAYSSHGIEQFDQRVTGSNPGQLTAYHNARFTTACQIAKDHNIKVFVIAYAQTLTPELSACSSPGQAFYASDTTALNTAFQQIAARIAMLRISK